MKRFIALVSVFVLALALTACGSDKKSTTTSKDGLTVSGAFGKVPKVKFDKSPFKVKKSTDFEAIEGDGSKVGDKDKVQVHVTLFNGKDGKKLASTLDQGGAALTTGKTSQNLFPRLIEAIVGSTVGSRVVLEAAPADAYGEQGNPQIGIGKDTSIVMVADVLKKVKELSKPEGKTVPPKAGDPKLKLKDGVPSGFDFTGASKPAGLKVITLIEGEGPKTKKGQTVAVNYLGSEFGSAKVFDASYGRGETFPVQLGQNSVIPAWEQGLQGVPVGSRILLVAPPKLAYGAKGSPPAIGKNKTLVFVIDVLGAS